MDDAPTTATERTQMDIMIENMDGKAARLCKRLDRLRDRVVGRPPEKPQAADGAAPEGYGPRLDCLDRLLDRAVGTLEIIEPVA